MTDRELIRHPREPRPGGDRRPRRTELTALDQAVGDGDHGLNMARGFDAVAALADELAALGFGAALQKAGMTLVMKVGGASGPLYGSGLMAHGQAAAERPADAAAAAAMLGAGIDAVKARGKANAGAKTMLDVLVPAQAALAAAAASPAARRGRCRRSRPPGRCAPPRAAPPFSANARSGISTRARARRRC